MWFEIIFGIVVYKLFRTFIYDGEPDAIPDLGSKHYDVSFTVANRLEKYYGGKAYIGLRIPDPNTSSKQHIEIVLVAKRQVVVVTVLNCSGFLEVGSDGSWICVKDGKRSDTYPDPVEESRKKISILESYLEQRGVAMPKGYLIGKVILPNPNCRTSYSIESQPEVISFEKLSELKLGEGNGFSTWIKDTLSGSKKDNQVALHQRLCFVLGTAPMWDRIEYKGDRHILGEFIEFKGKHEDDLQALRGLKRSKVSQIIVQKATFFGATGRSRLRLLYSHRDYRQEGSSASQWEEVSVKRDTEVIFQPMNSKKTLKFKLVNIVSLTLSSAGSS